MPTKTFVSGKSNNFKNSSTLCYWIRTVSAEVTHPLHAKQSYKEIFAVFSPVSILFDDLIKSGRYGSGVLSDTLIDCSKSKSLSNWTYAFD